MDCYFESAIYATIQGDISGSSCQEREHCGKAWVRRKPANAVRLYNRWPLSVLGKANVSDFSSVDLAASTAAGDFAL